MSAKLNLVLLAFSQSSLVAGGNQSHATTSVMQRARCREIVTEETNVGACTPLSLLHVDLAMAYHSHGIMRHSGRGIGRRDGTRGAEDMERCTVVGKRSIPRVREAAGLICNVMQGLTLFRTTGTLISTPILWYTPLVPHGLEKC